MTEPPPAVAVRGRTGRARHGSAHLATGPPTPTRTTPPRPTATTTGPNRLPVARSLRRRGDPDGLPATTLPRSFKASSGMHESARTERRSRGTRAEPDRRVGARPPSGPRAGNCPLSCDHNVPPQRCGSDLKRRPGVTPCGTSVALERRNRNAGPPATVIDTSYGLSSDRKPYATVIQVQVRVPRGPVDLAVFSRKAWVRR